MDIEAAVSEYIKNFDGGMGDVLEAFVRQMGESVKDSFRAGWNARQNAIVAEQTPTNIGMQANAQICQLIVEDIMALLVRNKMMGSVHVGIARDKIYSIVAGKLLHA